jgi:hypothetical protein
MRFNCSNKTNTLRSAVCFSNLSKIGFLFLLGMSLSLVKVSAAQEGGLNNEDSISNISKNSNQQERNKEQVSSERPMLVQHMGYPKEIGDDDYENEDIHPTWRKVYNHLLSNPEEASIIEDGFYPLDDALWVRSNPVTLRVIIRMLRIFPEAFTRKTYEIAYHNPDTRPSVMRLLRASDMNGDIVEERTELVKLMGFPKYKKDGNYEQDDVKPNWDAVRERMITNPEEVEIAEADCFPLADALWIESDPVPVDIVENFIKIYPQALTDLAFANASHSKTLDGVLRLMFSYDRKQDKDDLENLIDSAHEDDSAGEDDSTDDDKTPSLRTSE